MHNPKLAAVQKLSAVQRYLGDGKGEDASGIVAKAEPPLERFSYCILRGRFEQLPSLELRNRQGQVRSLDYSGITGINMDAPDELVLHYEGRECYTIKIGGKDLDKELLAGVENKRVVWTQELDELEAAKARKDDPTEPVVTGIGIAKGIVSREWTRTLDTGGRSR